MAKFFQLAALHSRCTQLHSNRFFSLYEKSNIVVFSYHRWIQAWSFTLQNIPATVAVYPGKDGDLAIRMVRTVCPAWNAVKTKPASLATLFKQSTKKCLLLAVDGPKGPLFSVPTSGIALAKKLNAPILPTGIAFAKSISSCSWDSLEIALPFITKSTWIWGEPFTHHLHSNDPALLPKWSNLLRKQMVHLSQSAKFFCNSTDTV